MADRDPEAAKDTMALLAAAAIVIACILALAEAYDREETQRRAAVYRPAPTSGLERERAANIETLAAWEAMRPTSGTDEECEARR